MTAPNMTGYPVLIVEESCEILAMCLRDLVENGLDPWRIGIWQMNPHELSSRWIWTRESRHRVKKCWSFAQACSMIFCSWVVVLPIVSVDRLSVRVSNVEIIG